MATTPCPLRLLSLWWGGAGVTWRVWWSSTCTTPCPCPRAHLVHLRLDLPGLCPAPGMLVGSGGWSTLTHGPSTPLVVILRTTWKMIFRLSLCLPSLAELVLALHSLTLLGLAQLLAQPTVVQVLLPTPLLLVAPHPLPLQLAALEA